jgi:energy-converting hydrogenase Eha subunit E
MFAEQRSRLALLSALIFLAGAGLVGVGAGQAVAGPGASDPGLPPDCQR